MYEKFYGLSRLPFQILPDPDFFYRSLKHDKALTCLEYGVFERAGFIVITGEIGTGKTTLLRYLLRSLSKNIPTAMINQTFLSPEDFLRMLCQEFSLSYQAKGKSELIELFGTFLIEQYKQGRYVILILDEAQNLPLDTLEEIRMLSNLDADSERLLQIILVGQPALRSKLLREELRQLFQRVEVSYHLEPLDLEELKKYIHYRLLAAGSVSHELFDEAAMEAIYDSTGGVPRLINLVCHRCLVYGFADGQKIITRDVLESMLDDRKREGLFQQGKTESSEENDHMNRETLFFRESSEAVISPADLTTTLNRLTEISEASMKAVELAAAKAAKSSGDENLILLKNQIADERISREQFEQRLNRTEDELAQLVKNPPEIFHENQEQNSGNHEARLPFQEPKDLLGYTRAIFSVKPKRRNILLIILIIVIFSLSSLALWRPKDPDINEQPPVRKRTVFKHDIPQSNVKPDKINQNRAPLSAEANSTSQSSDVQTVFSGDQNRQIETKNEHTDNILSPLNTKSEKLIVSGPSLSTEVDPKRYICVVEFANVRSEPNMRASIVKLITRGTEVEVIGEEGNWMQLRSKGRKSLWIYKTLLRRQN